MVDEERESYAGQTVHDDETAPDPTGAPARTAGEVSAPQARAATTVDTESQGAHDSGSGADEDPGREPGPKHPRRPRDAVVYVPGLAHGEYRIGVDALALRLASALDRRARTRETRFGVGEAHVVEYREEVQSRRITIEREDPGRAAEPVV